MKDTYYISLGHRCHIYQCVKKLHPEIVDIALPFDHLIGSLEGVIDCFENDFLNFFPKDCHKFYSSGKGDVKDKLHVVDQSSGKRIMFRGKYFCFTHHDLRDEGMVNKFKKRIERLDELLKNISKNSKRVIFFRTVGEPGEHLNGDLLINAIRKKYPDLIFKIIFIISDPSKNFCALRHENCIVSIDPVSQFDENKYIAEGRYSQLINFLKNNDIFNNFDKLKEAKNTFVTYGITYSLINSNPIGMHAFGASSPFDASN